MKNILLSTIALFCYLITNGQNKAEIIFKNNLLLVENYLEGKETKVVELKSSAKFLQDLTGIEYYIDFDSYELSGITSKQNVIDWEKWFIKNRKLLYWDEIQKKVVLIK
jgi:hypothetical protein